MISRLISMVQDPQLSHRPDALPVESPQECPLVCNSRIIMPMRWRA